MVVNCEKSYCDARSLKRHLENHHNHSPDQIAAEMVTATSQAAEILAEVSNPVKTTASPSQLQLTTSSIPILGLAGGQPMLPDTVMKPLVSQQSQLSSENNVLAQQLMMAPAVNYGQPVMVTLAVSNSTAGSLPQLTGASISNIAQQTTLSQEQYETLLAKHRQMQLQQEQQKQETIKVEAGDPADTYKVWL